MNEADRVAIVDRTCNLTAGIAKSLDGKSEVDLDARLSRDLDSFR